MPNCPFLTLKTLKEAFYKFQLDTNCSLLSSVRVDPILWFAFKVDGQGKYKRVIDLVEDNSRTQDYPALYVPSGAVWIASTNYLLKNRSYYGDKISYFEAPFIDGFDIDTYEQLEFARALVDKSWS
jgi:CMP-N-acetylneuraminic acid synthetase